MRSMKYVMVLLVILALMQPVRVSAHATLISSDPANGAVLTAIPATIVARFDEELKTTGPVITVTNGAGQQVDAGDGKVDLNDIDHKSMVATLKPGLGDGIYTIHWQAITADDGGVTQGTITFTVQGTVATQPALSTTPAASAASNLPDTGRDATGPGWL